MRSGGLKKWRPRTRPGDRVQLPIIVMLSAEVFEARTASSGARRSISTNAERFASASSVTDSIANRTSSSASPRSSTSRTRSSASSRCSRERVPRATERSSASSIRDFAHPSACGSVSCRRTLNPERATTSAMPWPTSPRRSRRRALGALHPPSPVVRAGPELTDGSRPEDLRRPNARARPKAPGELPSPLDRLGHSASTRRPEHDLARHLGVVRQPAWAVIALALDCVRSRNPTRRLSIRTGVQSPRWVPGSECMPDVR